MITLYWDSLFNPLIICYIILILGFSWIAILFSDESGSDSEAAESTSSSYSSLSDFVSEIASSDLSPGKKLF